MTRRRALTDKELATLRKMVEAGASFAAVARRLHVSPTTVSAHARELGLSRSAAEGGRMRSRAVAGSNDLASPLPAFDPSKFKPTFFEGSGPLVARFNEQQRQIWASGGPKHVRSRDEWQLTREYGKVELEKGETWEG